MAKKASKKAAKATKKATAAAGMLFDANGDGNSPAPASPRPKRAAKKRAAAGVKQQKPDFHRQTVLFQWAMAQLGMEDLEDLKNRLQMSADSIGGISEHTGLHRFHETIANSIANLGGLTSIPRLREYESNILNHTQAINSARLRHNQPLIEWKYFQYLTLLFTELFLDRYFDDAEQLRTEINEQIAKHNQTPVETDRVLPFTEDEPAREQLSRLAFWCATGSGKTLLMHVHVLQFRHYHKRAASAGQWPKLDQIILVTPNDGLSGQHVQEFQFSGIDAMKFTGQSASGLFAAEDRMAIKVIDIHKMMTEDEVKSRQEGGKRYETSGIVTEQMKGCNLVLVDEGHRGAGRGEDGKWLGRRDALAADGFSIEYSATFKEAAQGDEAMRNRYAKSILFDYAYRSFYRDGYGKDFMILNLEDDEKQRRYLTAALLLFYQQMKVWLDGGDAMKPFLIDKPLWVFVGHTVVGKIDNADDKVSISDVVEVLLFVNHFLANKKESVELIQSLLEEGFKTGQGAKTVDVLARRLPHLDTSGDKKALAREIHSAILNDVFHAPGGGSLAVQLLKGADGELALKVGENEPFGVVNVGDPAAVAEACEANGITRLEDDSNRSSLFNGINYDDSPINLLVGSRKFTEGWNSWRVSSLGLMRMGKNEGTQIIQLFGRGVRLRGYKMCLRRSSVLTQKPVPPKNLRQVETLQVFGVKASYMNTFRDWIFSEVPEAQDRQTWPLPIVQTLPKDRKLKTLRLRDEINGEKVDRGQAFRKLGPLVILRPPHHTAPEDAWLRKHPTRLNWLPRLRGIAGQNREFSKVVGEDTIAPLQFLNNFHCLLLDYDELLFGLEAFKASRGLDRLYADRESIRALLAPPNRGWYELTASADDMRTDRYENRVQWQRMAQQLLNAYAERFYRFIRGRWEAPYIEIADVSEDEENLMVGRDYVVESTDLVSSIDDINDIADCVKELETALTGNLCTTWSKWSGQWKTVPFVGHLYQPLLFVGKKQWIRISPIALDRHEARFVDDLAQWCRAQEDAEVYLLRNQSVIGLGFFQAANFFPDFLLWIQRGDIQHLVFVDPKGLGRIDASDPKIQFATRDIPKLQQIVDQQTNNLNLSAFIISNTEYSKLSWHRGGGEIMSQLEMEQLHVLFQDDGTENYIRLMMRLIQAPRLKS